MWRQWRNFLWQNPNFRYKKKMLTAPDGAEILHNTMFSSQAHRGQVGLESLAFKFTSEPKVGCTFDSYTLANGAICHKSNVPVRRNTPRSSASIWLWVIAETSAFPFGCQSWLVNIEFMFLSITPFKAAAASVAALMMPPMLSFHIHAVAVVNNKQKTNNNTMRVIPTANIIVQIITSRNTNVITYVTQTIQYNHTNKL